MEIKYTTVRLNIADNPEYDAQDLSLAGEYTVFTRFNPDTDFIQASYTVNGEVIGSNPDYRAYRSVQDGEYILNEGVSRIRINPESDVMRIGYTVPETIAEYDFFRNLFRTSANRFEKFYIDSISDDRTELRLFNLTIPPSEIATKAQTVVDRLNAESTFSDFKLLFEDGHTELAINLAYNLTSDGQTALLVKLYSPLPPAFQIKSELQLVEEVSETLQYSVTSEIIAPSVTYKKLSGPNFRGAGDNQDSTTQYLSSVDLLNVNTYSTDVLEVISKTAEKSATLGIDYSKFDNYIHYSSAVERLKNFVYKVQLIENYSSSLASLPTGSAIVESKEFYKNGIQNTVRNFDHYERYLYFESSSVTWPKQNAVKPYSLYSSTSSTVINWYSTYLNDCEIYDNTNYYRLMGSLPEYIREDPDNSNLVLFIDMLGQHFDNIKIYADTISKKYDTDNRVGRGLATSLIEPVLENFGVKLHKNDFKSNQDLFKYFVLTDDEVDSEVINYTSSISNVNVSEEGYRQELYKRLYHNLPMLLKTKGTERGLKVLMSTFGIPSNMFPVKTYGGTSHKDTPYFGLELPNTSGSFNKVHLDHTGSVEGKVLIDSKTIRKRQSDYQLDLHVVEVGPSPNDNINRYILENISSSFNIDQYIGDPRGYNKLALNEVKEAILGSLDRYDLKDFIRLIRFYDNTFFRMVRDFAPGRDVVDSGIIIKPNILEHNIVKDFSVTVTRENKDLQAEIDTAFITGSDGGVFGSKSDYITSYSEYVQYPDGVGFRPKTKNGYTLFGRHDGETPRYTGELSGSVIKAVEKELNIDNEFKKPIFFDSFYNITPIVDIGSIPIPPAVLVCCLPTFSSIAESGSNILLNFTTGSGISCLPAVGITYQISTDGVTWGGNTTVGTTSPITITKPGTSTYYRIRTECSGSSSSSYTTSRLYTVTTICCPPTLDSIVESSGNLTITYTTGSGGACFTTNDVTLESSIDGGSTWNAEVSNTTSNPIVITAPTGAITTRYRVIANCSGGSSAPSNTRNYVVSTTTIYINTTAVDLNTGIFSIAGTNVKDSPGISGASASSGYLGSWSDGSEYLNETIYVGNTVFAGNDNLYVVSGSNFNTSATPYDWAVFQINNSGVVSSVYASDGTPL